MHNFFYTTIFEAEITTNDADHLHKLSILKFRDVFIGNSQKTMLKTEKLLTSLL